MPKIKTRELNERLKKILELHKLGVTRDKMAKHLNLGRTALTNFIREHCPEILNINMRRGK